MDANSSPEPSATHPTGAAPPDGHDHAAPPRANAVRQFAKRLFNPLVLPITGRFGPYAVVRHVGRTSGRAYQTPVVAFPLDDGFVIPLPYGPEVDWCRNVRAAGECTILRGGRTGTLVAPTIVPRAAALPAFPPLLWPVLRLLGVREFLQLTSQPAGAR